MPIPSRETRALVCPECKRKGVKGDCRIGNKRNRCKTCNSFNQAVMRLTRKMMMDALGTENYDAIRIRAELNIYPRVSEAFNVQYRVPTENPEDLRL
jgi:hypothetical protein